MAQPEYGARYCSGAASDAVALTMMVYFMASEQQTQINTISINQGIIYVEGLTNIQYTKMLQTNMVLKNYCLFRFQGRQASLTHSDIL